MVVVNMKKECFVLTTVDCRCRAQEDAACFNEGRRRMQPGRGRIFAPVQRLSCVPANVDGRGTKPTTASTTVGNKSQRSSRSPDAKSQLSHVYYCRLIYCHAQMLSTDKQIPIPYTALWEIAASLELQTARYGAQCGCRYSRWNKFL